MAVNLNLLDTLQSCLRKIENQTLSRQEVTPFLGVFLDALSDLSKTKNPDYIPYFIECVEDHDYRGRLPSELLESAIKNCAEGERGMQTLMHCLKRFYEKAPRCCASTLTPFILHEPQASCFQKYMALADRETLVKMLSEMLKERFESIVKDGLQDEDLSPFYIPFPSAEEFNGDIMVRSYKILRGLLERVKALPPHITVVS